MKLLKTFCLFAAIASFTACSKESIVPEPTPTPTPEPEKKYINITASIAQFNVARSVTTHEAFATGDQMGLWMNDIANSPTAFNGTAWNATIEDAGANQTVYAVLPYIKENTNKNAIAIDIDKQEDYIYASGTTNAEAGVNLSFKHALAQIRLNLQNVGYTGTGLVSSITLKNIKKKVLLDLQTGAVAYGAETTDVQVGGNYNLNDGIIPAGIFSPVTTTDEVLVEAVIDGVTYQTVLTNPNWQPGYIYTYTLQVEDEKTPILTFDDEDVDVQYWATYGKDDTIENFQLSDEWDERKKGLFSISPAYAWQGWNVYKDNAAMFGVVVWPQRTETQTLNLRCIYIDDAGNIKGQTAIQKWTAGAENRNKVFCFFDYITLNTGHYRIVPIMKLEGESTWWLPYSSGYYNKLYFDDMGTTPTEVLKNWDNGNWGFNVLDGTDKLQLRDMWAPNVSSSGHYQIAGIVTVGEEFPIDFILTNHSQKAIKGTLIVRYDRGVSEKYQCFRPGDWNYSYTECAMDEFSVEVGRMDIDIKAGVRNWQGEITCKMNSVLGRNMASGCEHLYFQPEGSSEAYLLLKDWAPILNSHQTDPTDENFWGANVAAVSVKE